MSSLLDNLNDSQRKAVEHIDGPSLVIAGAGSGKTRVLTYKIAYLLSKGVPAYTILALTFTNKAAAEMKERVSLLVGEEIAHGLNMGTFHSVFAKILRVESGELQGYDRNFTILDADDAKKLIKQILKEQGLDYNVSNVASRISAAKNDLILPEYYRQSDYFKVDQFNREGKIVDIYQLYMDRCRATNAMDFDDLLLQTNVLFATKPEVLQKYQQRFHYVLVDEYQDTNSCQYRIVRQLALPENNLCVVGDDAQSIYSFRGAKIENILNFSKDYPNYQLFKLEENYRSTQIIVDAANCVIGENKNQIQKHTFSKQEKGDLLDVLRASTDTEEGQKVAQKISKMVAKGAKYSDFAILYRANAQSRIMEESLNKLRIPCKVVKGMSFFQRKEIKDVLSYARCVINPKDELALERIVNYPARAIGDTSVDKMKNLAARYNMSLWDVMTKIDQTIDVVGESTKKKVNGFVALIQSFKDDETTADAYSLMNRIVEKTGIFEAIRKECDENEAKDRIQNVQELLNGAKEFVEEELDPENIYLHNYLESVSLMTDMDEVDDSAEKVMLMTVHSAKGLEFTHCFLVGLEENVFPSKMSLEEKSGLEEERRLFYVALTRAKKTATLSFAHQRRVYGNLQMSSPSRFLTEIDSIYLSEPIVSDRMKNSSYGMNQSEFSSQGFGNQEYMQGGFGSTRNGFGTANQGFSSTRQQGVHSAFSSSQLSRGATSSFGSRPKDMPFIASSPDLVQIGKRVKHEKFGLGTVINRMGVGAELAVVVAFDMWGTKKLMLKFAKVQVVD